MTYPVGIIGLGRIGRCIVQGLLESKTLAPEKICFTTNRDETAEKAVRDFGIVRAKSNRDLVQNSETIVLAVKPQGVSLVLEPLKDAVNDSQTIVSVAASVTTAKIADLLGNKVPVIRSMPNIPVFVREGITALCASKTAKERDLLRAQAIFAPLGKVVRAEEKHMDAITGLSGSGPAYIYVILEALTEGGIKVGLPRDLATQLAAQTLLGAARMLLTTGRHPAALKDEVTTPAGCTIDGLLELEEGKLRITLMKAVVKATERAKMLASEG